METLGRTHIQLEELVNTRLWLSRLPAKTSKHSSGFSTGLHLTHLHGHSTEFDQVRDYQPGDDARHIDWRASARAGVTQSRLFHRERDRPIFIMVEQSPTMFFASCGNFKSVQAALGASLFAWAASSVHDRVGGLVFGQQTSRVVPPARNRQGTLNLLHSIYQANQKLDSPFIDQDNNPLAQALVQCQPQLRPDTLIVLICSESHLDTDTALQLGSLATRYDSIWLPVSDPLERQLPASRTFSIAGPQQKLLIRRQQQTIHQHWQQQAQQTRLLWQQLANQNRAILLPVCTSSSLAEQLPKLREGLHVASA